MREAIEITEKFLELLTTIDKNYDVLYDEVGRIDRETQDLLHDLEFDTFCGREGYKKAKRIKEIRQRRRELKDTMELVYPLKDYFKNHGKLKIDMHKLTVQMKTVARDQTTRIYIPRVRGDLKIANQHFPSTGEQLAQHAISRAG
jgi:hypothetical protein